jgi:PEGA domain
VRHKFLPIIACAALLLALYPSAAHAQRHRGRGGPVVVRPVIVRSPLLFGGYYGFGLYDQWYPYPYAYPIGYPIGPGLFGHNGFSSLRLQVTPREALVFVDGYSAGIVDDFDGVFQRLELIPGQHEIVVYQQGYRTHRENLYLTPGSSQSIRHTLVPLAPGETGEPQPVPVVPQGNMRGGAPWQGGAPQQGAAQQSGRFGTLTLRVQPGDANVSVDGESWRGPQSQNRLVIQLAEGPHQVRVEKPGFQPFTVDVDLKAGETTSFNVTLLTQ